MIIKKDTKKEEILKLGSICDSCGYCCKFSSGFLIDDDIKKISKFLKISEDELKQKYLEEVELFNKTLYRPRLIKARDEVLGELPYGRCIFLKDNKCMIHPVKPFYCRIATCKEPLIWQWFLLNYVIDPDDPEAIRQWNIAIKSFDKVIQGGKPEELVKDRKILKDILNFKILK